MGGISSEHDVSIMSGKEIMKNLNPSKYKIQKVVIDKDGSGLEKIRKMKPDVVFIALHGKGGEDGKIQGYLESLGIPHTGSGVLASAIGMDKIVFRELMKANGISVPKSIIITKENQKIPMNFKPPYFVKPYDGGSSVGTSFVRNRIGLVGAIKLAFKYSEKVLVEKYIKGLEINCGVIGNSSPIPLPLIEIHPISGSFFDYKSKYTKGGSEEITPANTSPLITKKIQNLSIKIYKISNCCGYARIDYILHGNKPIVLEINTLPGMTTNSLLPKEAGAAGISYPKLLDMIIDFAK